MPEVGNTPILKGMKIPSTSLKCVREMLQDIALPSLAKTGLTDFLQNNRAVNDLLGGGQSTPGQKSVGSSVSDQCPDAACGRQPAGAISM